VPRQFVSQRIIRVEAQGKTKKDAEKIAFSDAWADLTADLNSSNSSETAGGVDDAGATSVSRKKEIKDYCELKRLHPPEPIYSSYGPDHQPYFVAEIEFSGHRGRGEGKTKKDAEKDAYTMLYDSMFLNKPGPTSSSSSPVPLQSRSPHPTSFTASSSNSWKQESQDNFVVYEAGAISTEAAELYKRFLIFYADHFELTEGVKEIEEKSPAGVPNEHRLTVTVKLVDHEELSFRARGNTKVECRCHALGFAYSKIKERYPELEKSFSTLMAKNPHGFDNLCRVDLTEGQRRSIEDDLLPMLEKEAYKSEAGMTPLVSQSPPPPYFLASRILTFLRNRVSPPRSWL